MLTSLGKIPQPSHLVLLPSARDGERGLKEGETEPWPGGASALRLLLPPSPAP